MARGFLNHIWYKLLDEEGIPVSGATVYLYDFNSVLLNIVDSVGASAAQPLSTDAQGIFDFYVKDHIKAGAGGGYGYKWDTKYIISWSKDDKSGILSNDYLFGSFRSVETSGSSTRLNRAMSNYLGWMFEDHANFIFGTTDRCGSSSSSSTSTSSSSRSSSSSSSTSSSSSSFSTTPTWTSYFDDTRWTADAGSWNGSEWVASGFDDVQLSELGTWVDGYRPTKIRVTFTGQATVTMNLAASDANNISANVGYVSGTEATITFGSFDIADLVVFAGGSFNITDIEFLV